MRKTMTRKCGIRWRVTRRIRGAYAYVAWTVLYTCENSASLYLSLSAKATPFRRGSLLTSITADECERWLEFAVRHAGVLPVIRHLFLASNSKTLAFRLGLVTWVHNTGNLRWWSPTSKRRRPNNDGYWGKRKQNIVKSHWFGFLKKGNLILKTLDSRYTPIHRNRGIEWQTAKISC
jgi:hypothetical protein